MPAAASFEEAFDGLFTRAHRLARRVTGDDALAEDIAAEALARAYARWSRVGRLPWRDGWVLKVTSNLAIDAVRRRPPELVAAADVPEAGDALAVRMALVAALRVLPRRQRESVVLRYLVGMSEQEVAAALHVSPGSVKTHLHRGTEALRTRLGPTFREESLVTD